MAQRFAGIPVEAFEFYDALAADNSSAWFRAHRAQYDQHVRGPLEALGAELEEEFGPVHLYRPYRDARFHRGDPIKDHQGVFAAREDAVGFYLQVSAQGLLIAGGWYAPQGHQLARFREAVQEGHGAHVRAVLGRLRSTGWQVEGRELKTRPRGVRADDPDLDLLRMRLVTASRDLAPAAWMGGRRALTRIRDAWRELVPLVEWLADHVGPGDPAPLDPASLS